MSESPTMMLDIMRNGLVHRLEDGRVAILRPGRNGGPSVEIEVEENLADAFRLASGDIVEGATEPIATSDATSSPECLEDWAVGDEERDEPAAARGATIPDWLMTRCMTTERLVSLTRINGLCVEQALERPSPRLRRNALERAAPDRRVVLATGPADTTGRLLDYAAPFGLGMAGVIYGPHGSGLTRGLQAVVRGVVTHAPDCVVMVLLLRARGEEMTDWRRRFPTAEVVFCPSPQGGATPEQTLRIADLTLAAAQRQTELGRPVLLAVDSLTGLWAAMLEGEEADAQAEADRAWARRRIGEWMQAAGNFAGEGLLGSGLGGSLTLIGTVWHQAVDIEAEEEGETHPHLRLLEHILHETAWRVPLSGGLAQERLFPAIDAARGLSRYEEKLLSPPAYERLVAARQSVAALSPLARYHRLMEALAATDDETAFWQEIASSA